MLSVVLGPMDLASSSGTLVIVPIVEATPTERPSKLWMSISALRMEFATESRCDRGIDLGVPIVVIDAAFLDETSDCISSWCPDSGINGSSLLLRCVHERSSGYGSYCAYGCGATVPPAPLDATSRAACPAKQPMKANECLRTYISGHLV
mmetsp:Transcript_57838/g.114728  ORF Transcript_57838/g.114728 Transcript_57838/m.114728 type:complete len:150 (-) Transcript_57838:19-468(-)